MQLVTDTKQSPSPAGADFTENSAATSPSAYPECRIIRAKNDFLIPFIDTLSARAFKMTDLKKERNFFETRAIEYQTGGTLSWD